jgi:hypothetical protein
MVDDAAVKATRRPNAIRRLEQMNGKDEPRPVGSAGGDAVPAPELRVQESGGGSFGGVVDAEAVVVADIGDDRGLLAASVDVAGNRSGDDPRGGVELDVGARCVFFVRRKDVWRTTAV